MQKEGWVKSASRGENFKELISFCICSTLPRILQRKSEQQENYRITPPTILSNYIHAIYGMLYDIYFRYFWIRKFFQKNAPYNVCYCSFIEECPLITSLIEN